MGLSLIVLAMISPLSSVLFHCGVLLVCLSSAWAFNLDSSTAIVFPQPDSGATASGLAGLKSEFGASVTFHEAQSKRGILVGAPRASYTNTTWKQHMPGTSRPGVLYWCELDNSSSCRQLAVDTSANEPPVDGSSLDFSDDLRVSDNKTDMRLGETVVSSGPDRHVLVCASQYRQVWPCVPNLLVFNERDTCLGNPARVTNIDDPVGKCIVIQGHLGLSVGVEPDDTIPGEVTTTRSSFQEIRKQWTEAASAYTASNFSANGLLPIKTSLLGLSLQARSVILSFLHETYGRKYFYSWAVHREKWKRD